MWWGLELGADSVAGLAGVVLIIGTWNCEFWFEGGEGHSTDLTWFLATVPIGVFLSVTRVGVRHR